MRLLILGAGGHGQVVADILLCMQRAGQEILPLGFLDDDPSLAGGELLGLPVIGPLLQLGNIPHDAVIIGIGNNRIRQQLFARLSEQGEQFLVARHPGSILSADVRIGPGTVICAGVVVNTGSTIGPNAILNTGCTVDHHNQIAGHAHIAPGVHLAGQVHVGEGTLVGIGANVIPCRRIGAWSTIGAGTVVTRDIPSHVLAVGVPARIVRQVNGS
ncbi:MAG: acetyltransferase [Chloroflexi bacterium]|nr:acetyltransferase [Chloroflexota bacterium]